MSISVKGVYVKANVVDSDMFDIDVEKIIALETPEGSVTTAIVLRERASLNVVVTIPFLHYGDITVDNVFCKLRDMVVNSEYKSVPVSAFSQSLARPTHLTTQSWIGYGFFRIHTSDRDLILLIDGLTETIHNTATLNDYRALTQYAVTQRQSTSKRPKMDLYFHSGGLFIGTDNDIDGRRLGFFKFKQSLDIHAALNFYLSQNPVHILQRERVDEAGVRTLDFEWKAIGSFEYIQMLSDPSVIVTFTKNPVMDLLKELSCENMIIAMDLYEPHATSPDQFLIKLVNRFSTAQ